MHVINYKGVLADKEAPAYTKDLVKTIQSKGGTTVGTWLQSVSTIDLMSISLGGDPLNGRGPVTDLHVDYFVVLMNLLSSAEGLEIVGDVDSYLIRMKLLSTFVNFELMKRKGIDVTLHYENMTLNEDFSEGTAKKPIVEKGPNAENQLIEILKKKHKQLEALEDEALEDEDFIFRQPNMPLNYVPPTQLTRWVRFKNWIISKLK